MSDFTAEQFAAALNFQLENPNGTLALMALPGDIVRLKCNLPKIKEAFIDVLGVEKANNFLSRWVFIEIKEDGPDIDGIKKMIELFYDEQPTMWAPLNISHSNYVEMISMLKSLTFVFSRYQERRPKNRINEIRMFCDLKYINFFTKLVKVLDEIEFFPPYMYVTVHTVQTTDFKVNDYRVSGNSSVFPMLFLTHENNKLLKEFMSLIDAYINFVLQKKGN